MVEDQITLAKASEDDPLAVDLRGGLLRDHMVRRGRGVGADGVWQGGGELWELALALDASELFGRGEHPGGGPAQAHAAVLPALHFAGVRPDGFDHRGHRVRAHHRLEQRSGYAEAGDGERVGEAFAQAGGGVGVDPPELGGQRLERGLGLIRVGVGPRGSPVELEVFIDLVEPSVSVSRQFKPAASMSRSSGQCRQRP
jgi:hypothetical protein